VGKALALAEAGWSANDGRVRDHLYFHNGTVFDGRGFIEPGCAVLVSGGRITAVGTDRPPADAEPIDLGGGTLVPGFIDAHVHPVHAGNQIRHCDLRSAHSVSGYVDLVAIYAADHPDEAWIAGGGWSMDAFPGGIPTREALDAVVSDRPVFLVNRDGHGAWANSRALELAGIDANTPDPADGRIERDGAGNAVGMLQEGASALVSRLTPVVSADDWYEALLVGQERLLGFGITGWQDAIVGDYQDGADPLPSYVRAAESGTLVATVVGALWWDRDRGVEQIAELEERRGRWADERFRATTVKMMLDGIIENHTAAMLDPYLGVDACGGDHRGIDFIDAAELPRFVTELDRAGFQVHFHSLGDRAVRTALDAVEGARAAIPDSTARHHLAHLQVVHPDDVERFARLGATANIQALWAMHEPQMDDLTLPFLGEPRGGWQYPFRSIAATGAAMCAGSDWPVSSPDPLLAAHVAVNRTLPSDAGGDGSEPFLPEQAIDLVTMLAAYTSGSARVNGLDDRAGSIRPGMDADFAVTDADLSRIDRGDICRARVSQTWVRGALVAEAG
jgi:predicted amidohydrolase YtcJ